MYCVHFFCTFKKNKKKGGKLSDPVLAVLIQQNFSVPIYIIESILFVSFSQYVNQYVIQIYEGCPLIYYYYYYILLYVIYRSFSSNLKPWTRFLTFRGSAWVGRWRHRDALYNLLTSYIIQTYRIIYIIRKYYNHGNLSITKHLFHIFPTLNN